MNDTLIQRPPKKFNDSKLDYDKLAKAGYLGYQAYQAKSITLPTEVAGFKTALRRDSMKKALVKRLNNKNITNKENSIYLKSKLGIKPTEIKLSPKPVKDKIKINATKNRAKNTSTKKKMTKKKSSVKVKSSIYAPVAQSRQYSFSPPVFKQLDKHSRNIRVSHREFIMDITGSVNFTAITIPINPGLFTTFPWLSTIATTYEFYEFHKLRICYETRCATTVPGSFTMAPDYDAADPPASSTTAVTSYDDAVQQVPWTQYFCCDLNPKAMTYFGKKKYIRTAPTTANQDIKTYDAANVYACTEQGTAVNWGKLWIEYDVSLFAPQLPPLGSPLALTGNMFNTTPATSTLFGTSLDAGYQLTGSKLLVVNGSQLGFLYSGFYLITIHILATSITFNSFVNNNANVTLQQGYNPSGAIPGFMQVINTAGTEAIAAVLVKVVSPTASTALQFNYVITGGTQCQTVITTVSQSFSF